VIDALPPPVRATPADLPVAVAAALAAPRSAARMRIRTADRVWAAHGWGDVTARPLLLLHGVTSLAETWWRVGPALAATGRYVVAPDLPGHGETGRWVARHRFEQTAHDVADFVATGGSEPDDFQVVGHSWGAMIAAALPAAGIRPATIVLLDPPAIPVATLAAMLDDPVERPYDDLAEAVAAIGAANPDWTDRDVLAKARGLVLLEPEAARAVLTDNGDWDGGLAALAHPAAAGIAVRIIRGEERTGSLLAETALPTIATRVGAHNVLTIADGPHSPHRTHPAATVAALLRALG
jgi:pimeloyl-ACP methyl ester carboxylesterase